MPAGYNPLEYTGESSVKDVVVRLQDGTKTYVLTDTLLPRSDTSRYNSAIRSFVLRDLLPVQGKTYTISAVSPTLGTASASVTIPAKSWVDLSAGSLALLDNPGGYSPDATITAYGLIGGKAYVCRLFIDYDVLTGSDWVEGRLEIPMRYLDPQLKSLDYVVFPQLTVRPTVGQASIAFKSDVYKAALSSLAGGKFKGKKLIFKWAVFQLTQVEKNLFNYYSTVHAYSDAQSIRLDEPMYSNISGGYGLVGAYTLDSLVHLLPENFGYNNR
jgi:hypothetical protein